MIKIIVYVTTLYLSSMIASFFPQVEYFQSLNSDHARRCKEVRLTGVPYIYNATRWSEEICLTKNLCLALAYTKDFLLERVARYALGSKFRNS